jgi:hypothetical protein
MAENLAVRQICPMPKLGEHKTVQPASFTNCCTSQVIYCDGKGRFLK